MTVTINGATPELLKNIEDYVADLISTKVVSVDSTGSYKIELMPDMIQIAENYNSGYVNISMWDSDSDIALIRVNYFDFKDIAIN